jgi:threonine dehydratase
MTVMLDDVRAAAGRIGRHARQTPVLTVEIDGRAVTFKLEQFQVTGSFKFRGALNALLARGAAATPVVATPVVATPVVATPVFAASGGNHGLGVAAAARLRGLPAVVYLPHGTPEAKSSRIAAAGARVVHHGRRYAEAESAARAEAARSDGIYLHAYDDPAVIAGQGTIGLEIAAQAPECDAVVAAVGGGGLAAGLGVALGPAQTLVAVEPDHCDCLHAAFAAGGPTDAPVDSVAASALGASRAGGLPFALLRACHVRLAKVSDQEIIRARDRLWEELRLAVEPAAAVPFAAWLADRVPGRHACLVICGANTAWQPA